MVVWFTTTYAINVYHTWTETQLNMVLNTHYEKPNVFIWLSRVVKISACKEGQYTVSNAVLYKKMRSLKRSVKELMKELIDFQISRRGNDKL